MLSAVFLLAVGWQVYFTLWETIVAVPYYNPLQVYNKCTIMHLPHFTVIWANIMNM